MRFIYTISGSAADGQTWETKGDVEVPAEHFPEVANIALAETFATLTQGKAVYGKPGVGCNGPYRIRRMVIEEPFGELVIEEER